MTNKIFNDLSQLNDFLKNPSSYQEIELNGSHKNQKLSSDTARQIFKALNNNKSITKIVIKNHSIRDSIEELAKILPDTGIKSLDLSNNKIEGTDKIFKKFAKNISFSNLSKLNLFDNNIGKGISHLAEIFKNSNTKLSNLGLQYSNIGNGGVLQLSDGLTNYQKLEYLNLRDNGIGPDTEDNINKKQLFKNLANIGNKVENLYLSDNHLRSSHLKEINNLLNQDKKIIHHQDKKQFSKKVSKHHKTNDKFNDDNTDQEKYGSEYDFNDSINDSPLLGEGAYGSLSDDVEA